MTNGHKGAMEAAMEADRAAVEFVLGERPTGAKPKVIDGITFRCYRVGILRYAWISECRRFRVTRNAERETYGAACDGKGLGKRFRKMENAFKAAIKAGKATP